MRAAAVCAVAFAASVQITFGADLPDPTRPPQRQRTEAPASAREPSVDAPVLQSVLTGPGRAPSAIISGRLVEPGGTTHGMRLVRVTETSAVLSGPRGPVTLALTPGAEKRDVAPADTPVRTADAAPRGPRRSVPAEPK